MEKIYRGYPLEVKKGYGIFNPERTCSSEGPKKVPWMLYRREEQSGKTELTGNESRSEIDSSRSLSGIGKAEPDPGGGGMRSSGIPWKSHV